MNLELLGVVQETKDTEGSSLTVLRKHIENSPGG